jgi:predicted DNA-binding protein with PD1-like motif
VERLRKADLVILRFSDGEDLLDGIRKALKEEAINSGIVLGGVGMLKNPQLAFYKGGGVYEPIPLEEEVELCALNGNIAFVDGEPFVHAHATVGRAGGSAVAGHFMGGKVHLSAEIAITAFGSRMTRVLDAKTGLKPLRFE